MIEQLVNWDKSLLLYLNGLHNDFWDVVMYWISYKFTWIPFYLFVIFLVIRNYKLRSIDAIICIVLLITISDQVSVICFKDAFQRLRPCQDPTMQPYIHLVNNECGGLYGFVSGHAANTFAFTFFMIQILGKKIKYLSLGMIIWASVVSYTRIYLGVHYPLDVLCGAILGIIVGTVIGKTFTWYYNRFVIKIKS